MHIWSAISGMSACLGRRCWIETGIGNIYPNMFVLLIGPPGTRKTTAMNNVKKILEEHTHVRFSPKDTAGQRQGLISAMTEGEDFDEELDELALLFNAATEAKALDKLEFKIDPADAHTLYVCSAEFRSFLGQNNLDLTGFLLEMWDGEDYDYQLKRTKVKLKDPLLGLIGCTTPTEIASLLPANIIGQGFMSRFILVYSAEKYKKIAPSKAFKCDKALAEIVPVYENASKNMRGAFQLSKLGAEYEDHLYMNKEVKINDTRFMYYLERRHTHIMKLSCALAAMRQSQIIEDTDIVEADNILSATEVFMPEALGEFGLSPLALAKQKMGEFIQHAKGPVSSQILWMVMQRDMRLVDFKNAVSEMVNAGKISRIETSSGQAFVYNDDAGEALQAIIEGVA